MRHTPGDYTWQTDMALNTNMYQKMMFLSKQLLLLPLIGFLTTGFTASVPDANGPNAAQQQPLVMGIFPRRNAINTIRMFQPLTDYLSEQLGRPVKLVTAHDFGSFWEGVAKQEYDIVHYNQLHYIESNKDHGYQVILANEEFGIKTISAAIIARTDGGIDKLSDLKGKRVIFGGGRKAMISYIATTAMLRDAGLKAGDYRELFAKNPPNASLATWHHQSDAAGVGSPALKMPMVRSSIDINKIKFLAKSEPLVHLPWAVNKRLGQQLKQQITRAMLTLKRSERGQRILASAKLTGLYRVTDKDFDPHRRLIAKVAQ